MPRTLRQLWIMSKAKRKDEWQRFAALISVVVNRTNFSADAKPVDDLDCMPQWLVNAQDRLAHQRAKRAGRVTIGAMDLLGIMGGDVPMPSFDELYPDELNATEGG